MAQIIWPRSLAYKQYETIVAGLVSRVVSGRAFMDYRAQTMLFGTSFVSQAALPLPALIHARRLWWPLLLRVRHRYGTAVALPFILLCYVCPWPRAVVEVKHFDDS
jgi:hypothetical protein